MALSPKGRSSALQGKLRTALSQLILLVTVLSCSYVVGLLIETTLYGSSQNESPTAPEVEPQQSGALSDGQQLAVPVSDLSKVSHSYDLPPEVTAENVERHNDGVETKGLGGSNGWVLTTPKARELARKVGDFMPEPEQVGEAAPKQKVKQGGGGHAAKPHFGSSQFRPGVPGCRLRECDQVSAPFDLSKQYKGSISMHRGKWKAGAPMKVPKFLGLEGARSRMQRGKGAEVLHKNVKWSHLGPVKSDTMSCMPAKDAARGSLPAQGAFKTCAVVGNGGGLLLREAGDEIDAHQAVFRFNGGIVRGFETHVGTRTTFRLANFDHFAFHEDDAPAVEGAVLQHITRPDALQKLGQWCAKGDSVKHNLTVAALDPEFHYFVLNTVARGGPSNGFYGTILANELCQHVTLYGFQKNWQHQKIKYHYYDKVEPTDTQGARDSSEKSRFEDYLNAANEYARSCAANAACKDPRVDREGGGGNNNKFVHAGA